MLKFRIKNYKTKDILLNLSIPIGSHNKIDLVGSNPYISNDINYFDDDTNILLDGITKVDSIEEIDIFKDSILCLDKYNLASFIIDWSNKCQNFITLPDYTILDWIKDYIYGLKYMSKNSVDNTLYRNTFFNQREREFYKNLDLNIEFKNIDIVPKNVLPEFSWMAVDFILNPNSEYKNWINKRIEENTYCIKEAKKQFSYGILDVLNIPEYNNCKSLSDFFYFCCPLLDNKVTTNYLYIYKALSYKIGC